MTKSIRERLGQYNVGMFVWRGDVGIRNGHEKWALWNATIGPPTFVDHAFQS